MKELTNDEIKSFILSLDYMNMKSTDAHKLLEEKGYKIPYEKVEDIFVGIKYTKIIRG